MTPRYLAAWGAIKGLKVLGSADCTHPGWRQELKAELELDEASGLFQLKHKEKFLASVPLFAHLENQLLPPSFLLQGEVCCIYKQQGKSRRVHHLLFFPSFEAAERLCRNLERYGNLAADGRPMLRLSSDHLLELVLASDPNAFLIPAHIWTPWYSIFGSKSGFNSLEECFGDLYKEIFALETGLSSDPAMNRLWSFLDQCRLISNSDAHSGENLGREATIFSGTASYLGIYKALRGEDGPCQLAGTLEFFPEEGKYYFDGHRACAIVLSPAESKKLNNICPVCHKPLTLGVLHRVLELADRQTPCLNEEDHFTSLIPLAEILAEILQASPRSAKVKTFYAKTIARCGPELFILQNISPNDLAILHPALGEAIGKMRSGQVKKHAGFDGNYGSIRLVTP